ncbi:peptidase [Alteribacter lacisalsi]|uniref:Peptidase n=1 Tax=Alteribacter lacisalsi TaxID=2045244 RepID=A0A2W0H2M6_9BACI|nr:peptidoglycan-binding protein [Alteribacter lacisalsi]PYZ96054.1 peptidase [Alteribacter lacisalsi]
MKKVVVSAALAGSVLLAPQVADAALGDQTLREGMRHGDVQELQDKLKAEGYFSRSTTSTGYFGTITRAAVRDFQRDAGIGVDGIAGPQTFRAMGVSSNGTSSSNVSTGSGNWISFNGTLRSGARGGSVASLQDALNTLGYGAGTTGVFGPKTESAVRSFQRDAGIGVDGIAGPQTYRALNGESVVKSSSSGSSNNSGTSSSSSAGSSSSSVDSLISTARSVQGSPYSWGGTTPAGFDCSGFVNYVFSQNGQTLPRSTSQLWNARTPVSNPVRGDLVFFETRTGPSHVGIYLGNGQFIHSGASTGVAVASMSNSYWGPRYLGAGRF